MVHCVQCVNALHGMQTRSSDTFYLKFWVNQLKNAKRPFSV